MAGLADEGIAEGRNWDSDEDDLDERIREDTPGPDDPLAVEKTPQETKDSAPVLAPPVTSPSPKPVSAAATSSASADAAPAARSDGAWRRASPAPVKPVVDSPKPAAVQPARAHTPRAGKGKSGPPGLANEPAPTTPRTPPAPKKEEPRVRKEVRVRPGGVGMGLLSERVRRLVVETQESPRRREGSPGTPT